MTAKARKPKRFIGKIEMKLDFVRVSTTVQDCRELFPLRDKIVKAVDEIMKDHPHIGNWTIGVRGAPKGLVYHDKAKSEIPSPTGSTNG
jgi:hypothetical protein